MIGGYISVGSALSNLVVDYVMTVGEGAVTYDNKDAATDFRNILNSGKMPVLTFKANGVGIATPANAALLPGGSQLSVRFMGKDYFATIGDYPSTSIRIYSE